MYLVVKIVTLQVILIKEARNCQSSYSIKPLKLNDKVSCKRMPIIQAYFVSLSDSNKRLGVAILH